jgi:hypothetical protein
MQTILRHFITALGGVLLVDVTNTQSFVFGLGCLFFTWLWSLASKLEWTEAIHVSDDMQAVAKKALAALVSQGLAALSGYMLAHGFEGDPNDPAAVMLFLGNLGASRMGWHQKALGMKPVLLFALSSLPFALSSCSSTSQEAFKQRLEAAFVSAGREVSAVSLAATLQTLRRELALLEAKPVDADWSQQLLDQNRISAIKAAIRLGEERLKALRGGKSVIEVNPVSSVTAETATPTRHIAERSPARLEGPNTPTPEVSIPIYAPRVVAMLRQ